MVETELRCIALHEATPNRHSDCMVLREDDFRAEFEVLEDSRYVAADDPLFQPSYDNLMQRIHADDLAGFELAYRAAIASRKDYTIAHRVVLGDGSIRSVLERGRIAFDETGRAGP